MSTAPGIMYGLSPGLAARSRPVELDARNFMRPSTPLQGMPFSRARYESPCVSVPFPARGASPKTRVISGGLARQVTPHILCQDSPNQAMPCTAGAKLQALPMVRSVERFVSTASSQGCTGTVRHGVSVAVSGTSPKSQQLPPRDGRAEARPDLVREGGAVVPRCPMTPDRVQSFPLIRSTPLRLKAYSVAVEVVNSPAMRCMTPARQDLNLDSCIVQDRVCCTGIEEAFEGLLQGPERRTSPAPFQSLLRSPDSWSSPELEREAESRIDTSRSSPPQIHRGPSEGDASTLFGDHMVDHETEYLRNNVDHLCEVTKQKDSHIAGLEEQMRIVKEELAHYKFQHEVAELQQQDSGGAEIQRQVSSEGLEIRNLQQQLSAVQLVKECLNKEVVDLHEQLQEVNAKKKDGPMCVICMTHSVNLVCLPCRHLALCSSCGTGRVDSCPICRCRIEDRMQVFMP